MTSKFKWMVSLVLLVSLHSWSAPRLILSQPVNESMTVSTSPIRFKGRVMNGDKLTINGVDIPLNMSGQFDHLVPLTSENANHYFLIEASDGKLTTQQNRTIFYEKVTGDNRSKNTKKKPLILNQRMPASHRSLNQTEAKSELRKRIGPKVRGFYNFSDITLSEFVYLFSKEHQINIINTADAKKTLSIELSNMHPADVFDALINYWGTHWVMSNGMIRVVKQAPTRVYTLNYIEGPQLIQLISGVINISNIKTNPIDNSIIAQGSIEDLDHLQQLIAQLDVKPKQVLIEATIIETNFDLSTVIGTKPTSIKKTVGDTINPFNLQTLGYSFSMNMFENNSNVNILANPQILVTNHKTASIDTGNQTGYTTTTVTQTSTIENMNFLNTGITLQITPHISDTGEILMELSPSISEGQINGNKPVSSKTSTKTNVLIKDGETIVIGGLIQKKKTKIKSKIPFLSDVPILNLFLSQEEVAEKKMELSVLITPHIIKDSLKNDREAYESQ
ncbi:MAG: type II secretion system protein GspD [Candidatus Marinamargulisbacteria bacterium]